MKVCTDIHGPPRMYPHDFGGFSSGFTSSSDSSYPLKYLTFTSMVASLNTNPHLLVELRSLVYQHDLSQAW